MNAPAASYPVELTAPDISAYRAGNSGIEGITTFDSGAPGLHVALSAIVHGNELCGVHALDWLFRHDVRPQRGRLSLALINLDAYDRFDAEEPNATRWVDEDFNRLWTAEVLDGPRDSSELRRARQIRPWLDTVDLLLDIHSMQHKTAPLMMAGSLDKGVGFAREIGVPALIVRDPGHAAGKRMRDYAAFGEAQAEKNALLIECGQHWEHAAAPRAIETVVRFLRRCGTVAEDFAAAALGAYPQAPQRVIEVTGPITVQGEHFRFAEDYRGLDVIARAGTVIGYDDEQPVCTPYDDCVLIMPSQRLWRGMTAVRLGRFVG